MTRFAGWILLVASLLALSGCSAPIAATEATEEPITDEPVLETATESVTDTPKPPTATATERPTATARPSATRPPTATLTPTPDGMIAALDDHDVTVVAFSPDGTLLAAGHKGNGVSIWDVAARAKTMTLKIDRAAINAHSLRPEGACCAGEMTDIEFSPDGMKLAVARPYLGIEGDTPSMARIDVWDVATGEFITALAGEWMLHDLAFSPDGRLLAGAVDSGQSPVPAGSVILWDTSTWSVVRVLEDAQPKIMFSPDGRTLITHSGVSLIHWTPGQMEPPPIKVWNVASGGLIRSIHAGGFVAPMALSADGRQIIANVLAADAESYFGAPKLKMFDATSGIELSSIDLTVDLNMMDSLVVSPDGTLVVMVHQPGHVVVWDVVLGEVRKEYHFALQWPQAPVFSPDGSMMALGTNEDQILLLQVKP